MCLDKSTYKLILKQHNVTIGCQLKVKFLCFQTSPSAQQVRQHMGEIENQLRHAKTYIRYLRLYWTDSEYIILYSKINYIHQPSINILVNILKLI